MSARLAAVLIIALPAIAHAATLEVGAGQTYAKPSEAIAAAHDGDTVLIHPGQYFDCAVVKQNKLTIEGAGAGATLTDKPCQGKALLVLDGNEITVRNLTLQRARVPDKNGAGIRAEGGDLLIENVRFINNENGILSADNPRASIVVRGSAFIGNGKCDPNCAHAIYIGHIKELDVENSQFSETHSGHSIKSRAQATKVIDCVIQDGPTGTSSYSIDIPNGGSAMIEGNRIEKGPKSENHAYAIRVGEEGVDQPTGVLLVRNNVFTNDSGRNVTFLDNLTATPAQMSGNAFRGGSIRPLAGDGSSG